MTRGERRRVARLMEDVVRPRAPLPPVAQTDAVGAFAAWLAAAPRPNRLALRVALRLGRRAGPLEDTLRRIAAHCYFGDQAVARLVGYDAAAVVGRAVAVRAAEARP